MLVDPQLDLGHYRLTFRARKRWRLPPFAGDMWRRALKSAAHDLALRDDRLGGASTVAGYLFESAPGPWAQRMRRYSTVPHPLVIRPSDLGPRLVGPGEEASVDVILVGHGNNFLGPLLEAARAAGRKGLGLEESRGGAMLSAVHQVDLESAMARPLTPGASMTGLLPWRTPSVPPAAHKVTVHLITPLRVRRDGSYVQDPGRLDARSFLMTLVRRVSMLCYFHSDHPLDTDFAALKGLAQAAAFQAEDVTLEALQRPETRHSPPARMDGLVGRLRLGFDGTNPFWPYLWLARWIGIGHGANIGLGRVDIEAEA